MVCVVYRRVIKGEGPSVFDCIPLQSLSFYVYISILCHNSSAPMSYTLEALIVVASQELYVLRLSCVSAIMLIVVPGMKSVVWKV